MESFITNIVNDALIGIDYKKIILFGSRARGDNREDSDYDLLIVVSEDMDIENKFIIKRNLRKRLAKELIDADIIIKSAKEYNLLKDLKGSIIQMAGKEGVLL